MTAGPSATGHRPSGEERPRQIRSFEDLEAWQLAVALAEALYRATDAFPAEETFGLRSQMRRAAVSVPSNIAEGWGRQSRKDYVRFLRTARGSLYELRTQIEIARRVGLMPSDAARALRDDADRVGRVLHGLARSLT
ncbi:four helix bundle protein [Rubrivirga sp. IMCC43871]|uniref:four helix bundle protein n=1 Tax=Rubrivirga sp. IMCC43871 TaxID=3391575 RepID=UPI00399024A3